MFRALTTKNRSRCGYEQLGHDEPSRAGYFAPYLRRAKSLPAKLIGSSSKRSLTSSEEVKKGSKIHPFFSIFETRRKKKATAKPEFSRYLAYLKEGGMWDANENMTVIYYK